MNSSPELDDRIHDMLEELGRSAPPAPTFEALRPGPHTQRSRVVPVAAAAALVAVGIGGVMLVSGSRREPTDRPPATQPAPVTSDQGGVSLPPVEPVGSATAVVDEVPAGPTGPLLSTEIDRRTLPLLDLPGWDIIAASSEVDLPVLGGFEDALILVGEGARYDAPLFAGSVIGDDTDGGQSSEELLAFGVPVQVGDVAGALTVSNESVSLLFVPLDDGGVARINAVRIDQEQLLDLALRYVDAVNDGSNAVLRPEGWTEWETPGYQEHSLFSIRFASPDGQEIEINGENRGAASLLGSIAGETRTTRAIGDTEVAWSPQEESGSYWVGWRTGDWSFYAMANGFVSEQQFTETLQQVQIVTEIDRDGAGNVLVTPGNRAETVDALLADVPLPPDFDVHALRELPGLRDRYQEIARVSSAVVCDWLDIWFDAREAGNPTAGQPAADALATTSDWAMLNEVAAVGGWSSEVWETAAAANGGPGIANGGEDLGPPTRQSASGGLGCTFD